MRYVACCAAALAGFASPQAGEAPDGPARAALEQRRAADHWLRLEADRRDYRQAAPPSDAHRQMTRGQRLQQQALRDRQEQRRAADAALLRLRLPLQAPSAASHPAGVPRLLEQRRQRDLELRNRMERRAWPP